MNISEDTRIREARRIAVEKALVDCQEEYECFYDAEVSADDELFITSDRVE